MTKQKNEIKIPKEISEVLEKLAEEFGAGEVTISLTNKKTKKEKTWKLSKLN